MIQNSPPSTVYWCQCDIQISEKRTYVKKGCNLINTYLLTILLSIPFDKLPWFGCSAVEDNQVEYNIRPISKIVSLVLFGPCLLFLSYATAFMPHLGFEEITDIKAIETGTYTCIGRPSGSCNFCEVKVQHNGSFFFESGTFFQII